MEKKYKQAYCIRSQNVLRSLACLSEWMKDLLEKTEPERDVEFHKFVYIKLAFVEICINLYTFDLH